MKETVKILTEAMKNIPIIDTHEHYMPEQCLDNQQADFFTLLLPYVCDNMQSAGMDEEEFLKIQNMQISLEERFALFQKYLPDIRFTSYFRVIDRLLRKRYGFCKYDYQEIKRVSSLIQKDNSLGKFNEIKEEANIKEIMTFLSFDCHRLMGVSTMKAVPTVSEIYLNNISVLRKLEEVTGVVIFSFDDLLKAIDSLFMQYNEAGICSIKFGSAYRRCLDFKLTSKKKAEECFIKHIKNLTTEDSIKNVDEYLKTLDDYLTFYMVKKADQYKMNVFIHCGIHAWNKNNPDAAHSSYLKELISLNPTVSFTLLHCGYPYFDDSLLLARYYPNVFLNLTWVHILDRVAAVNFIRRIIELLPLNKIEMFGGDYFNIVQSIIHLEIAKENLAIALEPYVTEGVMTIDDAIGIANQWFYINPKSHYRL